MVVVPAVGMESVVTVGAVKLLPLMVPFTVMSPNKAGSPSDGAYKVYVHEEASKGHTHGVIVDAPGRGVILVICPIIVPVPPL